VAELAADVGGEKPARRLGRHEVGVHLGGHLLVAVDPAAEVTPELIAIKRELLTTKRLVRKFTSTVTENDHE
jgi:pheromone shutdown protein TraB